MNPENEHKEELTAAQEETAEETAGLTQAAAEEAVEEVEEESAQAGEPTQPEEPLQPEEPAQAETPAAEKKGLSKGAKISILIGAIVLLLGALAACVVGFLSAHPELKMKKVETAYGDTAYIADQKAFGTNDINARERYDIADTTADSVEMRTVVARDQDGTCFLTNGEMQVAFWMEFYQMMNSYGSYISMMGLDTTKPLYEQNSLLEGNTWEQYFLASVVKNISEFRALQLAAEAGGYELPEDVTAQLDDLTNPEGELAEEAVSAGYESVDAYLQENFGPGVTAKNYQNYMRLYITAMYYYQEVLFGEPYNAATDAEVEAYFDAHVDSYTEQGLLKANNVNVRHILIAPEGEKNSDGTYSEEAWAAAETEANRIYELWKQNETEENFSELAKNYSVDNAEEGGLYEDVAPGDMVTEFNDWCFSDGRKTGDNGIVRTKFGYHIIYFCGNTDTRAWFGTAKQDLAAEIAQEKLDEIKQTYTEEFDYASIRIFDLVSYANAQSGADSTEPTETVSTAPAA